jgi:hypothetical protein
LVGSSTRVASIGIRCASSAWMLLTLADDQSEDGFKPLAVENVDPGALIVLGDLRLKTVRAHVTARLAIVVVKLTAVVAGL